ncbi:hypothetical protein NP233_g2743 [Leucocoprinus birnbaumii]|uniref:Replication protein A subunit n=1 Tax=Leucocoprinus birnbaumii TaxID=56174 RepID=A0AAD5W0U0_9AGAR|nr:hypothetical protein NP233_g2743 [Leucocoprinus birnbaumii]
MDDYQLTPNCCTALQEHITAENESVGDNQVIQFLSVKKVPGGPIDRYRLIISDGTKFIQAMLATQCNSMVENGSVDKFTVASIEKASCSLVQNKRLVILLGVRVIGNPKKKIGSPIALEQTQPTAPVASTSNGTVVNAPNPPTHAQPVQGHNQSQMTFPIEGLSPYQNNWTIRARVTQKSDLKTWVNQKGEGKLFSVTLMDNTGEIRATAFNTVADDLFSRFEEGKVYFISKARVNFAKKKFNNLANDYELTLERNTQIEECTETDGLPEMKFSFTPLDKLETLGKDSIADVIGIIKDVSDVVEITTRSTNRQLQKRELTLVDKTASSVQLTLWGKQAESFDAAAGSVGAFKGVRVGDFGGVSLSMISSSQMQINPAIEDSYKLRGWFDNEGANVQFESKTVIGGGGGPSVGFNRNEARSLNEIKESELGMGDKADFFSCRGTIVHIRGENIYYPACTGQNCSKKMTNEGDSWVCDKCGNHAEAPEYRYIVSMAVADWSGQAWLQAFNDAGNVIFGMSASELQELRSQDEHKYQAVVHQANCKTYNFSCRAKKDAFDDRVRVRYGISQIEQSNYAEEGRHLMQLLSTPWAQ